LKKSLEQSCGLACLSDQSEKKAEFGQTIRRIRDQTRREYAARMLFVRLFIVLSFTIVFEIV
jgi:hypothetical protein